MLLISVLFVMGGGYLVFLSIDFLFAIGGASDMLSQSESESEFIFKKQFDPLLWSLLVTVAKLYSIRTSSIARKGMLGTTAFSLSFVLCCQWNHVCPLSP